MKETRTRDEGSPGWRRWEDFNITSRSLFRPNEKSSLLNHKAIKKLKIS
jgi:hypothetical protein